MIKLTITERETVLSTHEKKHILIIKHVINQLICFLYIVVLFGPISETMIPLNHFHRLLDSLSRLPLHLWLDFRGLVVYLNTH